MQRLRAWVDHRWAAKRIPRFVDDDLPPRQQRRLAAHERICPDCHRLIATLRATIARLRGLPAPERPPDSELVATAVAERIARGERRH